MTSFSNILYSNLNSRIRITSSDNLNIIGDVSISEFNRTYNFKDIKVNNVNFGSVSYLNGNVSYAENNNIISNANLSVNTIFLSKPNLSGNFKFNYSHPYVSQQFQINGNIIRISENSLNKIVWESFADIQVQTANIDFPKTVPGRDPKFSNIGDNNIIEYGSQLMINTNTIYNDYNVY